MEPFYWLECRDCPQVGIVLDMRRAKQSFFLRHDDDIQCLAQSPADRDTVATGQCGAEPVVWVWSSHAVTRGTGTPPTELRLDRGPSPCFPFPARYLPVSQYFLDFATGVLNVSRTFVLTAPHACRARAAHLNTALCGSAMWPQASAA